MHTKSVWRPAVFFGAAALSLTLSAPLLAADMPPDKPLGIGGMNDAVGLVDLAPHQLGGSPGDYDLRSRLITLAPGGAIQPHPHAGRPGIAYVTKGTVVETRGDKARTLQAGEWWLETHDTVHWFRNPSDREVAELWVVDIVAKKK